MHVLDSQTVKKAAKKLHLCAYKSKKICHISDSRIAKNFMLLILKSQKKMTILNSSHKKYDNIEFYNHKNMTILNFSHKKQINFQFSSENRKKT